MQKFGLKEYKEQSQPLNTKTKNYIFIIDEINRGEVSKIFGELFYSVDPGYRVSADDLEKAKLGKNNITTIRTQYANLELEGNHFDEALNSKDFGHFFIPENVYIIGTMNDIDRSVESMDFAFRRRFAWKEITADNTQYMLDEVEKDGVIYGLPSEIVDEAKKRMNRLNNAISELPDFNSAYHIGASYFLKLNQLDGDFESLWNYHLKGILEEYLRGNPEKDKYMTQLKVAYDKEDVTNE
jgi:5-methylcytosine-specific restriction endonuclease McrBC GTP-binding regulatory subunit McrB